MEIKEITSIEFWPLFDKWRESLFTGTLYFEARDVRTEHESSQFEFLREGITSRFQLHLVIYDGDNLVGWSSSYQVNPDELYMMNSAILPKYRRQGHYKRLMKYVLNKAKELGFQQVTSQHLINNNEIIVPKLIQGFNIVGTEVTDQFGILVKLSYFINVMRKEMYLFRSGAKWMTPEMNEVFSKHPPIV